MGAGSCLAPANRGLRRQALPLGAANGCLHLPTFGNLPEILCRAVAVWELGLADDTLISDEVFLPAGGAGAPGGTTCL